MLQDHIARAIQHDASTGHHHQATDQAQHRGFVGHQHQGLVGCHRSGQHIQGAALGLVVHAGSGLVKQPNGRSCEQQAGQTNELALSAAHAAAALGNRHVQAFGVRGHKSSQSCGLAGLSNGLFGDANQPGNQIVFQRAGKQLHVL